MTSALQRLQANEADAIIWDHYAPEIRQLYQKERRTLEEVKTIMERDKGFPVTPLSKWEVKLRDLKMKRRLKAKDWSAVYQHIHPRLLHDGRNKLLKPTAILISGTEKPWEQCWKEFRRNRVLAQGPHRGPLPPLPPGVVIRTPSPELFGPALRKQQSKSRQSLIVQLFQTTLVTLQPLVELDSQLTIKPTGTLEYQDSRLRVCLEGIPFTSLLEKISGIMQEDLPSSFTIARLGESQDDQIASAFHHSYDLAAAAHSASWKSQLTGIIAQLLPGFEPASPTGQELELKFDSHHYLSMVIYLLSNNNIRTSPFSNSAAESHEVTMGDILQMAFTIVSRPLLLAFLHTQLPIMKAAWEKLLLGAQSWVNEEAFRFLISIGMENDWLEHEKGHEYLCSAAQMNCSDVLRALIDRGCRADSYPRWCSSESIIVEALENSNLDCARLIIQNCDVNHEFQTSPGLVDSHRSTHFAKFIMAFDATRPDHFRCLELCLEQGADVDYQLHQLHPLHHTGQHNEWYWDKTREFGITGDWPLSILDYIYYWHRSLYPKLAKHSEMTTRLSRARALWYLDQGVDILREYLASDPDLPEPLGAAAGNDTEESNSRERKDHFLQALLAEQFLLGGRNFVEKVWWTRVKGFSRLKVDLTWLSKTGELAAEMLCATARLMTSEEGSNKEDGLQVLQWLLEKGFQVGADALLAAYSDTDVVILDCLASFCKNLKEEGGEVLAEAVYNSDFKATKLLLNRGVDPNSTCVRGHNVFESAARGSTFAMMKYVVQRGAKPRISGQGHHVSRVLFDVFSGFNIDLFIKVQYLVEEYITINDSSCPSANLLEACICNYEKIEERRKIFEFLWKKGAKLSPGSPLAQWIGTGGGHRLVQEMLDAGADPNGRTYAFDPAINIFNNQGRTPLQAAAGIGDYKLVCILMDRGADLNGPAVGDYGQTALQAICIWNPLRREERLRKDKIVKVFLERGADVNAANSTGYTALIYAAGLGDLSTAFALLKHGAKLDAIATSSPLEVEEYQQTALDAAAGRGRLDMVEFLLNANALSWTAFYDGEAYDGAIEWARQGGHSVVSEMICKHSADRRGLNVPDGQAGVTRIPPEHASQSLSLRAKPGTINALDEGMIASSSAASKAKGKEVPRTEAADVSWTRVIEEVEDEPPLADNGCERSGEGQSGEAGNQATDTRQALSGPERWLSSPREQIWVQDEQQNVDPLVSNSLSADVFMGFSDYPSP